MNENLLKQSVPGVPPLSMKRPARATIYFASMIALLLNAPAVAQTSLEEADLRLLQVAERLQNSNAPLCDRQAPSLGAALQSRDQYPTGSGPVFQADVTFAVLLPGGSAAGAGIVKGDGLLAVDGAAIAKRPDLAEMPLRDSAFAMLADHPKGQALRLTIKHGDETREVLLDTTEQCRALVEVLVEGATTARSDGRVIQVSLGLVQRMSDTQLAVVFAHELAHAVMHHRDRLEAQDVSKGLGGEFGRDRRLNAEAEIEADRLSAHLLANAGYDPYTATEFWRSDLGRSIGGGLLRSRVYSSPAERAAILAREIADYLGGGAPSWPGHLLARR
ncbi:M48 family metalloprotease [Croceibacterium salegens]|nr:M48 family metalloprotease [Croceibacterium salegens]